MSGTAPSAVTEEAAKKRPLWQRCARAIGITLAGALSLLALAAGGLWWWAGTEGSLATSLRWAEDYAAGPARPMRFSGVTGAVRVGGQIDEWVWQQGGLSVTATDVALAWQPWALLTSQIKLDRVAAASVTISDQRPPSTAPAAPPLSVRLPLKTTVDAFELGQISLTGPAGLSASHLAGAYAYDGAEHSLTLTRATLASGQYAGRAKLEAAAPLMLNATLSGALLVTLSASLPAQAASAPSWPTSAAPTASAAVPLPLPLAFTATATGPVTRLVVNAALQTQPVATATATAAKVSPTPIRSAPSVTPSATVNAIVAPWAAQPVLSADARFEAIDAATFWPAAPQTLVSGSASVQPLTLSSIVTSTVTSSGSSTTATAWNMQLQLANGSPGPWDQNRLPVERLEAAGQWLGGTAVIRSLTAKVGGGDVLASGQWSGVPASTAGVAAPAHGQMAATPTLPALAPVSGGPKWSLQASLQNINPALLHTQLAPLPVNGQATAQAQGGVIGFDAAVQATGRAPAKALPNNKAASNKAASALQPWRLLDASATGRYKSAQAGGTLVLSKLRLRTDDAALSGQLEAQLAAPSGKGQLQLVAPGLVADIQGDVRPTSGGGKLSLRAKDAKAALAWLKKLPGVPPALAPLSASGVADLAADWQGGWQDPSVAARLQIAALDWSPSESPVPAVPAITATAETTPRLAAAAVTRLRDIDATLSGRLSQAQLGLRAKAESGVRRLTAQLSLDAGRAPGVNQALAASSWQGTLKQLRLTLQDPALGAGAWQLATTEGTALQWSPAASGHSAKGFFEAGAGRAALTSPAPAAASAPASRSAVIAWQPVRWRPGELTTAGKITGLPLAWVDIAMGSVSVGDAGTSRVAAANGLSGDLVFDGQWDAWLADTLSLKASLAHSSGDLTVQAETGQGTSTRVTAGIKQASLQLNSAGERLTLALLWDTERAGRADGQLTTQLSRTPFESNQPAPLTFGGWHWPPDAPLNGQLRAQLPRIGVWSALAPPGWRIRGALGADVAIKGTRANPQLSGDLQANDLALRSVVDGIELGNGRLRAQLDGNRMRISEFSLQGAGDWAPGTRNTGGTLTATGEAAWVNGQPQAQLDAKLDRLRASLRSDRQITLSGTASARLAGQATELSGNLAVDQARIVLPEEGTPQLGDDVVVRGPAGAATGQKAPAQSSGAPASGNAKVANTIAATPAAPAAPVVLSRTVKSAVQIDLGRDFKVTGKGLDTLVRGNLTLSGDSFAEPRLVGSVNTFGGQYRAYGQRLTVEQGQLRFTGPLNNPVLDILAIRPNLTQRVGVQINGTALLPRVRLYAQPELPDAEKLSWLVLGRSSASGGGEAALLQEAALALLGSRSGGASGGLAASLGLDELSFRSAANNADGTTSESAVTLGKRFSRNFYAAYERSISGALGTLFVFYDLSQRFTVRAQAGQQSAIDLIFTVPYD